MADVGARRLMSQHSEIAARSTARHGLSLWTSGLNSPPELAEDVSPPPSGPWICSWDHSGSIAARSDFRRFRVDSGARAGVWHADIPQPPSPIAWNRHLLLKLHAGICGSRRESTLHEATTRISANSEPKRAQNGAEEQLQKSETCFPRQPAGSADRPCSRPSSGDPKKPLDTAAGAASA